MSARRYRGQLLGAAVVALSLGLAACETSPPAALSTVAVEGNPGLGRQAIKSYGCGSCHTIPGVDGADALVGPPLVHFSKRSFIAGQLPNTPENLARWVQDPQGVEPGTAMPTLGVTAEEARNIAAYLESLE
ncbi:MAG: c-type cytochrome [Acidimicrobiales bacterium]